MARKRKRKYKPVEKRIPKDVRRVQGSHEKRLSLPFSSMTDTDVIQYFLDSNSFLRKFINYTNKDYKNSSEIIREVLLDVQKEDFAQFVRVCHKAYSDPCEDRRGFFNQIVCYIQDEAKLLYQKKVEQELVQEMAESQWVFPIALSFLSPHKFLYDFSIDFFLNNAGETELRNKYKLNRQNYIKTLIKIKDFGITPVPL